MVFANLLAMPYYIHLSHVLFSDGVSEAGRRHLGVIASIIVAGSWLFSWRIGIAIQLLIVVVWLIA